MSKLPLPSACVEVVCRYSNKSEQVKTVKRLLRISEQAWPERAATVVPVPVRISRRLDEGTVEQIIAGYESGRTGRELALRYDLARSTVIQLLRDRGVSLRPPRVTPDEQAEMVRLYRSGVRQVDIARQFGRDKGLIWHVLHRAGEL